MQYNLDYSKRHAITLLQFYSYRLAMRNTFSVIDYAGKLFQQYVVDTYVKTEASRLEHIHDCMVTSKSHLPDQHYHVLLMKITT